MIDKYLLEMKIKLIIFQQANRMNKLSKKPKNSKIYIKMDYKILEDYQIKRSKKKRKEENLKN
jgi:hypothetical protein